MNIGYYENKNNQKLKENLRKNWNNLNNKNVKLLHQKKDRKLLEQVLKGPKPFENFVQGQKPCIKLGAVPGRG